MARKSKRKGGKTRKCARKLGILLALLALLGAAAGDWYVHHPRKWLRRSAENHPRFVTAPLLWIGNPVADLTDALGWTGHDAIYEYDSPAPEGQVFFAGAPRRIGAPCPADIKLLDRGEFAIGWSPSKRHPVWCAYHVTKEPKFPAFKRPSFARDRGAPNCPAAGAYERTGYDRGHMTPNYAIVTRYGEEAQRQTFLMSNISPQSPSLNRDVWRNVEHRIADLWTAKYGEIWVIVGTIPSAGSTETLSGTDIEVPGGFYQIVAAQEGLNVRALAVSFPQSVAWGEYPTRGLVTIDELEQATGLDFFPELPSFIQDPLEAELPSRLWPIRARDLFRQLALRFVR